MRVQHFISISGGADSQGVMCLALERLEKRGLDGFGNMPPRFLAADTGHENPITLDHIAYLDAELQRRTGLNIEICSANDVPGLTDEAAFARKRDLIRVEWTREKRRTMHRGECVERQDALPTAGTPGRGDAVRAWKEACDCPVRVSPPVPEHLIEHACSLLKPSGIPFLDIVMLHGRFPGVKTRFCTDETKLIPMEYRKAPLLRDGVNIVEWIGERADESPSRAAKPALQRVRTTEGPTRVLFRPVHHLPKSAMFELADKHGLKHNPLYTMGMSRVGCSVCIMVKKRELSQWAMRFPEEVARVREWERIAGEVSRRTVTGEMPSTLLAAKVVPGDPDDNWRAQIDRAVAWSHTSRGGNQFDLLTQIARNQADEEGLFCDSEYGLCE